MATIPLTRSQNDPGLEISAPCQRYGRKQLTKSPNDIGFEFDKEFAGLLNSGDMLTSGQSKLVPEDSLSSFSKIVVLLDDLFGI